MIFWKKRYKRVVKSSQPISIGVERAKAFKSYSIPVEELLYWTDLSDQQRYVIDTRKLCELGLEVDP
jgi:hypothetical protein